MSNWPFQFEDQHESEEEFRRRGGGRRFRPSRQAPPPTPYPRRRRFPRPAFTSVTAYVAPPSDLQSIQERLTEILGMQVPSTGQWNALTRRAIRLLQGRRRLPITGRLDRATRRILFAAPPISPPLEEPAPFPQEPRDEPPSEPQDQGPEEPSDEPAGEPQEEIHISKGCVAILERGTAKEAASVYDGVAALPVLPGLYVIRKAGKPIYVGIAELSIHSRFQQRYKALRDFGLDSRVLAGVTVTSYALKSPSPACIATRRPMRGGRPVAISPKEGLLRVLEQHFIRHFRTSRVPPSKFGNSGSERYTFGPGETITVRIANGAADDPPAAVTPASRLS